jgi:hypothetical protein
LLGEGSGAAARSQDVASIVQVLRPDDQLVRAAWHAISRPRSHVRLSERAFDIGTPQQGAEQFGFRLAPNDFDHNQFDHATTLCALSERERVCLGAGLEECDLERPLADGVVLAHELVHAAVSQQAVSGLVDVHAV